MTVSRHDTWHLAFLTSVLDESLLVLTVTIRPHGLPAMQSAVHLQLIHTMESLNPYKECGQDWKDASWLRALATPPEEPGLVPRSAQLSPLTWVSGFLTRFLASSSIAYMWCLDITCKQNSYMELRGQRAGSLYNVPAAKRTAWAWSLGLTWQKGKTTFLDVLWPLHVCQCLSECVPDSKWNVGVLGLVLGHF